MSTVHLSSSESFVKLHMSTVPDMQDADWLPVAFSYVMMGGNMPFAGVRSHFCCVADVKPWCPEIRPAMLCMQVTQHSAVAGVALVLQPPVSACITNDIYHDADARCMLPNRMPNFAVASTISSRHRRQRPEAAGGSSAVCHCQHA